MPKKADFKVKMRPSERQNTRVLWKSENEKLTENCRNFLQSLAVFYLWLIPISSLKSAFFGIEMALERAF
jgi:hypothetical protein